MVMTLKHILLVIYSNSMSFKKIISQILRCFLKNYNQVEKEVDVYWI